MQGIRQPSPTTSSARYWQAYHSQASAFAPDHRVDHAYAEPWAQLRRVDGSRTPLLSSRHQELEQRYEIRSSVCIREPPPLVPPSLTAIQRDNSHSLDQRMRPRSCESRESIHYVGGSKATPQRRGAPVESTARQLVTREPPVAVHSSRKRFHPRVLQDLPHPESRVREELRRLLENRQQGSQALPGRTTQELPSLAVENRVKSEPSRYLPVQRRLPSLMECRSLSSLSDTSIPSPRFDSLAKRTTAAPRLTLDSSGLFTKARRPFPSPRFSFPVNSPSLFSVLGSRERPTASADVLATGTATKASLPARKVQLPPSPEAKKKLRRTRVCTTDGCVKLVVDHGVCIRHGGGKRCNVEGCECRAQNRGLCWKHGGYTICTVDGCAKRAKSRGMCWSHGGGTQCKQDVCTKIAVSRGRCWAHGGGKRCKIAHCQKPAALRLDDFCAEHHNIHTRQTAVTNGDNEYTDSDR